MTVNLEEGKKLVKFARDTIEHYIEKKKKLKIPEELKEEFGDKMGAFVTLNRQKSDGSTMLRGCIGITEPRYPLIETIHHVALSAAFQDPRFPAVKKMDDKVVEVTVLTKPELIKVDDPSEYLEKIKIGRDGLLIEHGFNHGLLLPQVPTDHNRNWDVKTFLEHTCLKANLHKNAWKKKDTKIFSFQGIIFEEESPNGPIHRKQN